MAHQNPFDVRSPAVAVFDTSRDTAPGPNAPATNIRASVSTGTYFWIRKYIVGFLPERKKGCGRPYEIANKIVGPTAKKHPVRYWFSSTGKDLNKRKCILFMNTFVCIGYKNFRAKIFFILTPSRRGRQGWKARKNIR